MRRHNYTQLFIWAMYIVMGARYVGAFLAADLGQITGIWSEFVTFLSLISGIGMAILDVSGSAYIFDGWRNAMPKAGDKWSFRFRTLTYLVVATSITGIFISVCFTQSRIRHVSIDSVLGSFDWLWSFAVNAIPYLLLFGLMVSQKNVVSSNSEPVANAKTANRNAKTATAKFANSAFQCPDCQETFAAQNSLNAHRKIHRNGNGHNKEELTELVKDL